jgi:hypothetical protein
MRRWLVALLALVAAAPAAATPEPVAKVTVERQGTRWTADYQLLERAPVWVFAKSVLPRESKTSWRLGTVRVLTPGVRLQRLGNFDALVSAKGALPKHVRLSFTPYLEDIEGGYDPALAFADGSVALYAEQFKLVPMKSASAARRVPPEDSQLPGIAQPTRMTFVDRAGPVLIHGKRELRPTIDDGWAYVLFGRAEPVIGPAMTTIMDPALPKWVADYLNAELPKILAQYREELGPSPVGQPTLLVSWAGPQPHMISLGGSVLPGMVVMTLAGDGLLKPNDKVGPYARWFVSHEAAHFWLGQAVHYSDRGESWITEGGAELLAFRATAAADPSFDVKGRLSEARDECAPFVANGGIASAYEREGDFRAYYACGAILALAAEKASGGDFADFVRTLIRRYGADQTVTRAEWLALLDERAGNRELSAAVSKLLDQKQSESDSALNQFIAAAGIADQFAPARPAE